MKSCKFLIFTIIILISLSCSEDQSDNQSHKSTPANSQKKHSIIPAPNPTNSQKKQPDLHISGSQNTHISGATSESKHVSGQ